MNFKAKIAIAILAVAVIFSAAVIGFKKFYLAKLSTETAEKPAQKIQSFKQKAAESSSENPTGNNFSAKGGPDLGWKLYKNRDLGFEIQYPASWTVAEEINENVRGEMVKEFFFKNPDSDLRFAILPRDGLSYGLETAGTSTPVYIGGFPGMQTQYVLKDGRRLWLLFPQYGGFNWLQDIGRIDAMTSATDPVGDTRTFEKILSSFKLIK